MLTENDLKDFKSRAIGDELLEKIYEEINSLHEDPSKVFYKELILTVKALSRELQFIREGKKELAHIIASDDKTFERVTKLVTDADKIFNGIRKGKEDIDPEAAKEEKDAEKESGMSFTDKIGNKRRKEL